MKKFKAIIQIILYSLLAFIIIYGLGYFLTDEANIMIWSVKAKIWFLIFLLLTEINIIE